MLEATCLLLAARTALTFFDFPRISRSIGELHPPESPANALPSNHPIALAIDRAAELLPFAASCLPRALAASGMLRRRAIAYEFHFGMCSLNTNARPTLHAWLTAGSNQITGYPLAASSVELGVYHWGRRPAAPSAPAA